MELSPFAAETAYKKIGDPILLDKIDKLFACNVGEYIDLPQLVVVGDQFSGKSSVLEGLTRLPFPRDSGLAANYSIKVSILPDPNSTAEYQERLDAQAFATIMSDVTQASGLRKTFLNDVLRLEIHGPDEAHLSVIDVPGIFRTTTTGVTTTADKELVRHMVETYIRNPRTVMLTVVPANVDPATQEILEMAKEVDPDRHRTISVLTKPDLVDKGAEQKIMDIIKGKGLDAKLDCLANGSFCVCKRTLDSLSAERDTADRQAKYLLNLAMQFQHIADLAVKADYEGDGIFDTFTGIRLATELVSRNEKFSMDMEKFVAGPSGLDIFDWLKTTYSKSRGFELGTFASSLLTAAMRQQSSKWQAMSSGYTSDAVALVHNFITTLLHSLCGDDQVSERLLNLLLDGLLEKYSKSLVQAKLLDVELLGVPMTLNHYFNDNLEKRRQQRMKSAWISKSLNDCKHGSVVPLNLIMQNHPMNNADHTIRDMHDILYAYYKVARKRFVDNVCMHAAGYHLIHGPDTPLKLFSPSFVLELTQGQLQEIAGEDSSLKRKRAQLKKEIQDLEAGRKILM
ncbi:hypothetical protein K469DRAFT_735719 [Zopfia rhizophila CBS 207.26]|uniref:Interferon-induced GTP-binding protein Mx2 n=1 Tax=Zopfia rhizophila CBS 207.26 TaxID=1314779 RepID=A0A6A6ELB6_9PEZI|nr:hypothetical protein K469DRAFT_735719 [Zopfia rhizophila CBS 207.26]